MIKTYSTVKGNGCFVSLNKYIFCLIFQNLLTTGAGTTGLTHPPSAPRWTSALVKKMKNQKKKKV